MHFSSGSSHLVQHFIGDESEVVLGEGAEHDHFIQTVQQLGPDR